MKNTTNRRLIKKISTKNRGKPRFFVDITTYFSAMQAWLITSEWIK